MNLMNSHLNIAPIVILGANGNKVNFTTIGDIAIAGLNPTLIMISVHTKHCITEQIILSGKFSVNIPEYDQIDIVKFCASHSGHSKDKSFFSHEHYQNIPFLTQVPQVLFCKIREFVVIETRQIIIGEIIHSRHERDFEPLLYTLDDVFHVLKK